MKILSVWAEIQKPNASDTTFVEIELPPEDHIKFKEDLKVATKDYQL